MVCKSAVGCRRVLDGSIRLVRTSPGRSAPTEAAQTDGGSSERQLTGLIRRECQSQPSHLPPSLSLAPPSPPPLTTYITPIASPHVRALSCSSASSPFGRLRAAAAHLRLPHPVSSLRTSFFFESVKI